MTDIGYRLSGSQERIQVGLDDDRGAPVDLSVGTLTIRGVTVGAAPSLIVDHQPMTVVGDPQNGDADYRPTAAEVTVAAKRTILFTIHYTYPSGNVLIWGPLRASIAPLPAGPP
jgi:hypothetical protein